ncbi:nitroreductase family protein [Lysinibacillus irui]|uniref:Nitroreductase family protein n=1 Tax=Lysinibacillus irui TaxID=2998077 RepID=A0ABU5NGZ1_9BACI|nr:nitroreductase family protein [Lysinibacillus irui]MEA0552714.1 nitroreductase family protein [Lysinibacillus irui]MEA0975294.1 nitroreductase family protein [Lysinibacillus irui]MEA1041448.1 nitroreductase family protein [Lysinibacillus irui]
MSETTPLKQIMQERKSVRKYNPTAKISRETIMQLIEDATSAPSSSNMQPWRFIVIDDKEIQKNINFFSFNQEQIETASAIIAVIGDIKMYLNAEEIYAKNVELGYMPEEIANRLAKDALAMYGAAPTSTLENIVHFDAGLVSMQIMLLAKEMGYDTVPMGGFDKAKFAEYMELPENEIPILLLAIGEAAAPAYGSSRLPIDRIVRFNK